jgi:hypothetical protein
VLIAWRHCARNHRDPADLSSPTYGNIFHVFAHTHSHSPNNRCAQTFIKNPHQKLLMLRSFVDFFSELVGKKFPKPTPPPLGDRKGRKNDVKGWGGRRNNM